METLQSLARWAWETSLASSFLILLAVIAQRLLRKPAFTSARHLLGLLVLARLLLPHSFESSFSIFNWINPVPLQAARITPAAPSASFASSSAPESTAPSTAARSVFNYFKLLPFLWLSGAGALLARVAWQHLQVRRWIRASSEIQSGPLRESLDAAQALAGSRRNVSLRILPQISTAALTGIARPKILLPPVLAVADAATLRLIFLHEIAHIRRQDILINWAIIVARALHWFNPLAWIALRRLNAEQELMCDAAVMRRLRDDDRRNYGETLLTLASSAVPSAPALPTLLPISAGYQQMKERIAMIRQFTPSNRILAVLLPLIAAGIALVTFTAASNKSAPPERAKPATRMAGASAEDKRAIGLLRLEDELDRLTKDIRAKEEEMDKYRQSLGIVGPVANEDSLPAFERIKALESERVRYERDLTQASQDYDRFKGKDGEKLPELLWAENRDPFLNRLLEDLGKAEQDLVLLQKDFSGSHPEVKAVEAKIKNINFQIAKRAWSVVSGMESVVQSRSESLDRISAQIEEMRRADVELRRSSRPFFALKRDIETMQKMRETLLLRILQEKIDSQLTRSL